MGLGFGFCTLPSVSAGGRFPIQDCFAWKCLGCDPSGGPALPCHSLLGAECTPRLPRESQDVSIPSFLLAAVFCALCQVNSHFWCPSAGVVLSSRGLLTAGEAMAGPPPPGECTFIAEMFRVLEITL